MTVANQKISVILPVYNGGAYLMTAILSVIRQTYRNWELLLLDDGSTDHAVDQIDSLNDSRIKVFRDGINKGLATRLNEGVALASGEYIARMDADDIAFPERFARQINFLNTHPDVDLLGCRILVFREGAPPQVSGANLEHDEITRSPWRGFPLAHPSWMGRIEWFKRFPYYLPEFVRAEDQELLLRASSQSRYACLNEVLLAYRQNDFKFARTQLARRSILKAQWQNFSRNNQWKYALLAVFSYFSKTIVDILANFPGCDFLFFRRMGALASPDLIQQFKELELG
jgi:glycosyltransferase involved in cell wall biosynthesis